MSIKYMLVALVALLGLAQPICAQIKDVGKQDPKVVTLIDAATLVGDKTSGEHIRYLTSDSVTRVVFKQKNTWVYCDSAVQYVDRNQLAAFGNVFINDNDSIRMYGDSVRYDGFTRIAKMRGEKVLLTDNQASITSTYMDYNALTGIATYKDGGTVKDSANTLTSEKGYYNTKTKNVSFKNDVVLQNPKDQLYLNSDTLTYNTVQQVAYFDSYTRIDTKDGLLIANKGYYDTKNKKSYFQESPLVDNQDVIISAKILDYDQATQVGIAQEKVEIYSKKDTFSIYGNYALYEGQIAKSSVFGNAVFAKPLAGTDTLFIAADTLIAVNDTINDIRYVKAYPNVRIFTKDIKGICDSLHYLISDSLLYMFKTPILWNGLNQLSADTVSLKLKENKPDKLFMNINAFVISQDSTQNHNQISGRNMVVHFKESYLQKVDVTGNGETIYFLVDDKDQHLVGMNQVACSNMLVVFADSNRLSEIKFYRKPTGTVFPSDKLPESGTKLKNYQWRIQLVPTKDDIFEGIREKFIPIPILRDAQLLVNERFDIYYKSNTLIYVRKDAVPKDVANEFFLELFDHAISSDQEQKVFDQVFSIEPTEISNGQIVYQFALPEGYQFDSIATGQFYEDPDEQGQMIRKYIWQSIFEKPTSQAKQKKNSLLEK